MPTIERINGWAVRVIPGDHRPAHVHVVKPPCEAVFILHCQHGPVELRESYNCTLKDVNELAKHFDKNVPALCAGWEKYHANRH